MNTSNISYLNKIQVESIRNFTEESLRRFGTDEKIIIAEKVADVVWQKFVHLGYITELAQQQFVDLTISACLLHNLFYIKEDITTILQHRVCLKNIVDELGIDIRIVDLIYELIESQLGENHPIAKLKPSANTPAGTMADAIWQISIFSPTV